MRWLETADVTADVTADTIGLGVWGRISAASAVWERLGRGTGVRKRVVVEARVEKVSRVDSMRDIVAAVGFVLGWFWGEVRESLRED